MATIRCAYLACWLVALMLLWGSPIAAQADDFQVDSVWSREVSAAVGWDPFTVRSAWSREVSVEVRWDPFTVRSAWSREVSIVVADVPHITLDHRFLCPGMSTEMTVSIGSLPPSSTYQWYHSGVPLVNGPTSGGSSISGATADKLQISGVSADDAGQYLCVVTGDEGEVASIPATLEVYCSCSSVSQTAGVDDNFAPPPDAADPSDALVAAFEHPTIDFDEVPGSGSIPEQVHAAHTFAGLPPGHLVEGILELRARAGTGFTQSDRLRLAFATTSGLNQCWSELLEVYLDPPPQGEPPPQWDNGEEADIEVRLSKLNSNSGGTVLQAVENLQSDQRFIDVIVSDDSGVDYMKLTMTHSAGDTVAFIGSPPEPVATSCGLDASFEVTAGGTGPLSYTWRKDGIDLADGPTGTGSTIEGANSPVLAIRSVTAEDVGAYDCLVSNVCHIATSESAALSLSFGFCDFDEDCDVDLDDFAIWVPCAFGPAVLVAPECEFADLENDGDVDQSDFGLFQRAYTGPREP